VLAAAWADPEIARWNPVPPDASVELARSWISSTSDQSAASVGIDVVLIDREVLGEIGFQIDPARSIAELGFWLRAEARGQGHGTTLLTLALAMAQQLELVGLVALTDIDLREMADTREITRRACATRRANHYGEICS
jgi:RimJ/RimL family protein N-acetyltransferase